jgi:hypothetical protein
MDTAVQIDQTIEKVNRIDIKKAFVMRFINGVGEPDIAARFGVSKQAVNQALKPFAKLIPNHQASQTFRENKALILDSVEHDLVSLLLDRDKRKKATLGNVAYALDKINNINRLERGLATSIVDHTDLTSAEREEMRRLEAMLIDDQPQDVVCDGETPDPSVVSD